MQENFIMLTDIESIDHTIEIVEEYLSLFPDEKERIHKLIEALHCAKEKSHCYLSDLYESNSSTAHITASAVILTEEDNIFQIHHNAINKWLNPGGHAEKTDANTYQTARRELSEETGVNDPVYKPLRDKNPLLPFDIDCHEIPLNKTKRKDKHWHLDFRYLFVVDKLQVDNAALKLDEVQKARIITIDNLLLEDPKNVLLLKLRILIENMGKMSIFE